MTTDLFNNSPSGRTVGLPTKHGNTSKTDLSSAITGTKAYLRWRQKFETAIDWGGYLVKQLYVNYKDVGDFVLTLTRKGSSNWLLSVHRQTPYEYTYNDYFSTSAPLDDGQWHTYEVYMDWSPTSLTCGTDFADCTSTGIFWLKIDGLVEKQVNDMPYRDSDEPGADLVQIGWPANRSGSGGSGTCNTWLDDLEIWDDLPGIISN